MISISKPIITAKDIHDVATVLKSGMLIQGPKVKELEEKFAQYCKTKHAIAVNNGTAALHTSLYAIGVKENDEVITTPFTFVATANAILMQNAKVVFADINEESFNLSTSEIEKKITKNTKAILPVSLYGRPFDQKINQLAKKYNLKVVEDAAQSIGASRNRKKSGNLGDISTFSLYATKNIMSAEGGMITTNNPELAELCRRFRHHGQSEQTRYQYHDIGYNYRLTDIQAAIGLNQIVKIKKITDKRNENAKKLSEGLKKIPGIIIPNIPKNIRHAFHQYTIRITPTFKLTRDELKEYMAQNGIITGIYYPKPLHLHPHFKKFGYQEGQFPIAEKLSKEVLSIPVHPSLTKKELTKIVKIIETASL